MALSCEDLYQMQDNKVIDIIRSTFKDELKNSPSVHPVFFKDNKPADKKPQNSNFVDDVACALVCSSIARSSLYGFSSTIDKDKADTYWKQKLDSSSPDAIVETRNLYSWAFPSYCKSDVHTFSDYLNNDTEYWAAQFKSHITSSDFLQNKIARLMMADEPQGLAKLNMTVYKLQRLGSKQVDNVVSEWEKSSIRGITKNWPDTNMLHDWLFKEDEYIGYVNSAINKTRISPSLFVPEITTYYGEEVVDFMLSKPRNLKFLVRSNIHAPYEQKLIAFGITVSRKFHNI